MEIFLNLVWLSLCLATLVVWIRAIGGGSSELRWNTIVAVMVLLMLLFPVISITDDLVAMNAPAEWEHDALRGRQTPLLHVVSVALLGGFALCALCLFTLGVANIRSVRIRPHGFAARLRAGFVRASGVRPPPSALGCSA